jgi:hypothetical protein
MKTVNNKVEHTTGKWVACSGNNREKFNIETTGTGNDLLPIATLIGCDREANAAFIVKAVNNYYPMLEALKIAREYVMHMKTKGAIGEIDKDLFKIEAAIKQAEQ